MKAAPAAPRSTDTAGAAGGVAKAVIARSGSLSWLKSPTDTVVGEPPTAIDVAGTRVPSPVPVNTDTLPSQAFAETTSSRPSPFTSTVTTDRGCEPAAYCTAAW